MNKFEQVQGGGFPCGGGRDPKRTNLNKSGRMGGVHTDHGIMGSGHMGIPLLWTDKTDRNENFTFRKLRMRAVQIITCFLLIFKPVI